MIAIVMITLLFACWLNTIESNCAMHNNCNGHGVCDATSSSCRCYEGWGAESDVTLYRAPDCSKRVCPSGKAWSDVPTGAYTAHFDAECSNRGTCNRDTGECSCYEGFTGQACQRNKCPNDCSGHGVCMSIKQMARMSNALPLAPNTYYEGSEDTHTWDEEKLYGCVCDSSWTVGLASGETQEPEWFGPDCSLRHCPSGDDPRTIADETNCQNKTAANSKYVGEAGNLCHVDCSNRGMCDFKTGACKCFNGFYGVNCGIGNIQAVYKYWSKTYDAGLQTVAV